MGGRLGKNAVGPRGSFSTHLTAAPSGARRSSHQTLCTSGACPTRPPVVGAHSTDRHTFARQIWNSARVRLLNQKHQLLPLPCAHCSRWSSPDAILQRSVVRQWRSLKGDYPDCTASLADELVFGTRLLSPHGFGGRHSGARPASALPAEVTSQSGAFRFASLIGQKGPGTFQRAQLLGPAF